MSKLIVLLILVLTQYLCISQGKNVLLICVDDLRPALGAYDDGYAITPNIDELASESIIYRNAFAQQAVCNPSRASMLTGLRPSTTEVYNLKTHFREKLPDVTTLPELFKDNGYHAVGFGKIFHNNLDDSQSWSKANFTVKNLTKWKLSENISLARESGSGPATEFADGFEADYRDAIIVNKAKEELRKVGDKPFFIAVGLIKPHLPFVAPKKFWDLYDGRLVPDVEQSFYPIYSPLIAQTNFGELRQYSDIGGVGNLKEDDRIRLVRGYYACVSYIDSLVGELLSELKEQGLYENTVIVFWGDHGFKLGEFGSWSKHTNYDIDTRVPLIIRDVASERQVRKEIVESIDIYKSIADYFDLTPSQSLEGDDIIDTPVSTDEGSFAVSFMARSPDEIGVSIRTARYRYTLWPNLVQELYDFRRFGERLNLASDAEYANVLNYFYDFTSKNKFEVENKIILKNDVADFYDISLNWDHFERKLNVRIHSGDIYESLISSIEIYSLQGSSMIKKILANPENSTQLQLGDHYSGFYVISVQNTDGEVTRKKFLITEDF
ncbi:MAG: sulfatase-like hydrolase/transferase [Reichenbachiella sp.]|uniref:sulfatase-like hydrolase/transferase n=1 Tax=Reichenbachiella sp. TaxID=2184521 RepID=UPI003266CC61